MEETNDGSSRNTVKQLKSIESSDLDDENSKEGKPDHYYNWNNGYFSLIIPIYLSPWILVFG